MYRYVSIVFLIVACSASHTIHPRPAAWGKAIVGTSLSNFYAIDDGIYRSAQPDREDTGVLTSLGVKEVLNLRQFHSDNDELKNPEIILHRVKMNAAEVTEQQIVAALRVIKDRRGPILIHCWHGSDRTGVTIAAYRVVFNHWSKAQALEEMRFGGYGFHEKFYPNLVALLENLNVSSIRKKLALRSE